MIRNMRNRPEQAPDCGRHFSFSAPPRFCPGRSRRRRLAGRAGRSTRSFRKRFTLGAGGNPSALTQLRRSAHPRVLRPRRQYQRPRFAFRPARLRFRILRRQDQNRGRAGPRRRAHSTVYPEAEKRWFSFGKHTSYSSTTISPWPPARPSASRTASATSRLSGIHGAPTSRIATARSPCAMPALLA